MQKKQNKITRYQYQTKDWTWQSLRQLWRKSNIKCKLVRVGKKKVHCIFAHNYLHVICCSVNLNTCTYFRLALVHRLVTFICAGSGALSFAICTSRVAFNNPKPRTGWSAMYDNYTCACTNVLQVRVFLECAYSELITEAFL